MDKHLTIIEGGKDALEETFQRLLSSPESFSSEEFESLTCQTFKDRFTGQDRVDLLERRVRRRSDVDVVERNILLAIIEGDYDRLEHLNGVLERRNKLGLKVLG